MARMWQLAVVALALVPPASAPAAPWSPAERDPQRSQETLAELAALPPESAAGRRVWVHFTDKGVTDAADYGARLASAAASLTPHAAARRSRTLGPALVDHLDLPLHEPYVVAVVRLGATVVHRSRWLDAVSVRATPAELAAIAALPFVRALTPVRGGRPRLPATGPAGRGSRQGQGERELLDYGESLAQLEEINVPAAHAAGWSGAGVIIAMLDTGFWRVHPAFQRIVEEGRLLAQWDFVNGDGETQNEPGDPEGQDYHGTSTWSVVGGFVEGELIGAAYGASYLLAKTEDVSGETPAEEDDWVAGAEWADALGADVISSSLAYWEWYSYEDMDGNTAVTTIGADVAASRGIAVCTAAGNYGTQDWYYIAAPGDADSVLTCGASRADGGVWDDSSHGPTYDGRTKPEVVARGDETHCAIVQGSGHGDPDAIYWNLSGTSMSTPLVAGCAALVLEAHPGWTPMMVREALMLTADNADAPDNDRGWGLVDVMAAIAYGGTAAPPAQGRPALRAWPVPARAGVSFALGAPARSDEAVLELFTPSGRRVRTLPAAGLSFVEWDGRDGEGRALPSGIYLARLVDGARIESAKLVLGR